MSLKDLAAGGREITVSGSSFMVNGITLVDLANLTRNHLPAMKELFDAKGNNDAVFESLISNAPDFITAVLVAGTGEDSGTCSRVPAGVQLRAIAEIWALTALDMDFLVKLATQISSGAVAIAKTLPASVTEPTSKSGTKQ